LAEPVLHSRASLGVRGLLLAWLVVMAAGRADAQVTLSPEVSTIRGGELVDGLAPPFTDDTAAQPGPRPCPASFGVAADELFRYRTVDSLPAIRSDRATDDDQFRVDAWLSGVDELVGVSGTYRARWRQVAIGTPWKE